MRKYQLFWHNLKTNGTVLIDADRSLHKSTIPIMMWKESKRDVAFQEKVRSEGRKYYMSYSSMGTRLRINLVWTR